MPWMIITVGDEDGEPAQEAVWTDEWIEDRGPCDLSEFEDVFQEVDP